MKNKTIKTIACVLAGLTLTACGGETNEANAGDSLLKEFPSIETLLDDNTRHGFFSPEGSPTNIDYELRVEQNKYDRSLNNVYAGIFKNVDVGERLERQTGTAIWKADIETLRNTARNTYTNRNFRINFGARTIKFNDSDFDVDLSYTEEGIISGDITVTLFVSGFELPQSSSNVYGLIGQDKAVGIFTASETGLLADLAGGFVASPQ